MPDWCPNCNAMFPDGLKECPRCGIPLGGGEREDEVNINRKTIAYYSLYTIGIVLVPIIIGLCIGLLCLFLFIRQ